jgi:hypothetical protein
LALLASISGATFGAANLGVTLILIGGLIYMQPAVTRSSRWLVYLGIVLAMGLPYSPSAAGLAGLMASPSLAEELGALILFSLVIAAFVQRGRSKADLHGGEERIVYLTHPLSQVVILAAYVGIGLFGWPGSFTPGAWSAVILAAAITAVIILIRKPLFTAYQYIFSRLKLRLGRSGLPEKIRKYLSRINLNGIRVTLISIVRNLVVGVSFLLEGPVGLLWGLILMVILVMAVGGAR